MSASPKHNSKNACKRSLTQAGIEPLNDNAKKQKLTDMESDDEDMVDPHIDDIKNNTQLIDLCEQCIGLIIKYLLPNERIQCFILCKQIKSILQDPENKTIWNDIRLSLKHSNNTKNIHGIDLPNLNDQKTENEQFKLKFIHSQSSYCKKYKNCIQIEIDKQYKNIENKIKTLWIFKCIPTIEIYDQNATIYDSQYFPSNISLHNIKYLALDCLDNTWDKLPKLVQIYPNLNYLSFMNIAHNNCFTGAGNKYNSFHSMCSEFNKLKSLKCLQFWDCNHTYFANTINPISITTINNCISQIMSLDLSFCSFTNISDIQNIMDSLTALKYLSFISNGIELRSNDLVNMQIGNVASDGDDMHDKKIDVDIIYTTLKIPDTLQYLKYSGEILIDHRSVINLDLSNLKKTNSLKFVDCCIDDILLLEQVSKYCSKSIQYILLNYDRDSHTFLHLHWSKYEICNNDGLGLQIGVHNMENVPINDEMRQTLKQFLMKTFMYDYNDVVSRRKLYGNYFRQVVSHINDMAKVNEATDFFEW